jgi:hypothetical protein
MSLCDGPIAIAAAVGCLICGFSWLYWLRAIGLEVNETLPESERVRWDPTDMATTGKMHRLWNEHERRFPGSRKRTYAAISFVLVFLLPIGALVDCILRGKIIT